MKLETATIRRLSLALQQSGRAPSMVLSSAYETLTRRELLSPEEMATLARIDPLAETMYLMMAADGKLRGTEEDAIRGAIRGLGNNGLRTGTITVMLENYQKKLEQQGRDARLSAIAGALEDEPGDAECAFALAAAIAMADDEVADEENELINELATLFKISSERATELLDELDEDRKASEHPDGE